MSYKPGLWPRARALDVEIGSFAAFWARSVQRRAGPDRVLGPPSAARPPRPAFACYQVLWTCARALDVEIGSFAAFWARSVQRRAARIGCWGPPGCASAAPGFCLFAGAMDPVRVRWTSRLGVLLRSGPAACSGAAARIGCWGPPRLRVRRARLLLVMQVLWTCARALDVEIGSFAAFWARSVQRRAARIGCWGPPGSASAAPGFCLLSGAMDPCACAGRRDWEFCCVLGPQRAAARRPG